MTAELVALAKSDAEYRAARALFAEYASTLGVDLSFQGFTSELNSLETMYGPPAGCLLLARGDSDFVGCIGVRRWSADSCEMKRLYVRDAARGAGVGRALVLAAVSSATSMGYRRMLLDTLSDMSAARRMYVALGFRECEPYCHNPIPGTMFMEFILGQRAGRSRNGVDS
jgi:GNAT superfamily N-acetyltransferase